jgi:hypothetical protein
MSLQKTASFRKESNKTPTFNKKKALKIIQSFLINIILLSVDDQKLLRKLHQN